MSMFFDGSPMKRGMLYRGVWGSKMFLFVSLTFEICLIASFC